MRRLKRLFTQTIFLLLLPLALQGQFDSLVEKITAYNQKYPQEILYIQLDREVYYPGDTLWFKAYLRNKVSLKEPTISKTLFMKILNSDGSIIHHSLHPLFQSEARGQIGFDDKTEKGFYELICYSSWMKNGEYPELFRKTIQIKEESAGKERFAYRFDRERYFKGDTIQSSVDFLNKYGSELPDINIRYRTGSAGNYLERGMLNTSGPDMLQIIIDEELANDPELILSTTYKGRYFDTIIALPILNQLQLVFYPEGGTFIEGLNNIVAFKAQADNGLPVDVRGSLYSENGGRIVELGSDFLGMGTFSLIPEPGKRYYVELSHPPNVEERFHLPDPSTSGWMMQCAFRNQNLMVSLSHTFDSARNALITVSVRDMMLSYVSGVVDGFRSFTIPTGQMPAGIAVVTLFDAYLLPRAERLVFINPERMNRVSLEADHSSYLPRDSVSLRINVSAYTDKPVRGSYSLSVVDEQMCMSSSIDEPDIVSSFYLTPEIRGRIHHPEHYFNSASADRLHKLELLLLTQGWRKYRYDRIRECDFDSLPPLKIYDVVSGQLYKYRYGRKGVPARGTIRIFNAGGTADFNTDEHGRFRYMHLYHPTLSPNVVLFGEDLSGESRNMEIILDTDRFEEGFGPFFREHADSLFHHSYEHSAQDISFEDQYTLGLNNRWIEEVIIYGKRRIEIEFIEETFLNARSAPDGVMKNASDIYEVLTNMGLPVRETSELLHYEAYPQGPIHWYVDDVPRDYLFVKYLRPENIRALFFVKHPDTQFFEIPDRDLGEEISNVIVSLHTIPFSEQLDPPGRSHMVILPKVTLSKEFYKPLYDTEAKRYSQVPDLRKTIHWEPNVQLDENGEATITYYNGDRYTRVTCILEGIGEDGIPVFGESAYEIFTVRE